MISLNEDDLMALRDITKKRIDDILYRRWSLPLSRAMFGGLEGIKEIQQKLTAGPTEQVKQSSERLEQALAAASPDAKTPIQGQLAAHEARIKALEHLLAIVESK